MPPSRSEISISSQDVGQTQVITVARMAHHLERAVQALAKRAMVTREEFGEVTMPGELPQVAQVAFEVVEFELEQLGALRLNDVARLEITLDRLGRTSARLDFRAMRSGDNRTAVQGHLTLVSVEPVTRKAVTIPHRLRITLMGLSDDPEVPA